MSLDLDERSVDRLADRAWHRQLADLIRAAIDARALAPGEALPSEGELVRATGLGKATVREALGVLATEGRITRRAGQVARVALVRPVIHVATSRYREQMQLLRSLRPGQAHPLTSAFVEDRDAAWRDYLIEADYEQDVAGPGEAAALQVPVGFAVLRRHLLKRVGDQEPPQLQESTLPLELVAGTAMTDSKAQPVPGGTLAELWEIGIEVVRWREEVTSRMPTTAERRALGMEVAGSVYEIARTFSGRRRDVADADVFPVEATVAVVEAARVVLRWEGDC